MPLVRLTVSTVKERNNRMIKIEVYADVVCPWCYIGEKRLDAALAQRPDLEVERNWRPFQLRPEMPPKGANWQEFSREKFGGADRAQQAFNQVTTVGASDGITFDFTKVASAPNTVDAHRLVLYAARQSKQWEMAEALFAAYFTHGRNLNEVEHLLEIAENVGLARDAVAEYLQSDADKAEVAQSQHTADEYGISSVPTFIINGEYLVSGAQPPETFLRAFDLVTKE
jgi:predicted DsbA family dithiol-disulfide isomerase